MTKTANASKRNKDAIGTATSSSSSTVKKRGWDDIESLLDAKKRQKSKAKDQTRQKNDILDPPTRKRQHQERIADEFAAFPKKTGGRTTSLHDETEFIDDGLGGKFNKEGYTGRVQDGVRIFKAHVLSKPGAGTTKDCPFDCTCCYI